MPSVSWPTLVSSLAGVLAMLWWYIRQLQLKVDAERTSSLEARLASDRASLRDAEARLASERASRLEADAQLVSERASRIAAEDTLRCALQSFTPSEVSSLSASNLAEYLSLCSSYNVPPQISSGDPPGAAGPLEGRDG